MPEPQRPGLRERKKSATRALIIEVAHRLFLADGFDAVTLERVANDCEVSVRTILRYFKTKEALALAMERDRFLQFQAEIKQRDIDAITFWRNFVSEAADNLEATARVFRQHLVMVFTHPSLFAELLAIGYLYEDTLADAINEDTGGANPLGSRLLATVLVGGNNSTVRQWVTGEAEIEPRLLVQIVDYAVSVFQPHEFEASLPRRRSGGRRARSR